jgi:hypothetical protein
MKANTNQSPAQELPTLNDISRLIEATEGTRTMTQDIAILNMMTAHLEILIEDVNALPDLVTEADRKATA